MAVVTISRQFGAGGQTLGERLCERFKFHLVDASVINQLARKAKISPDWLNAMEKEAASTLLRIISSIVSKGTFYRTPAAPGDEVEQKKYIAFLSRVMTSMADEGGYVLVGRGSQLVLRNHPKALHVMLVGNYEERIKFLTRRYNLSRTEAEAKISEKERERASVAANIFGANIDDPRLYHMVLNTSRMPFDWALELVADLLVRFMKETGDSPSP
jgi:cytidylate kinase